MTETNTTQGTKATDAPGVWPTLKYDDAPTALRFLTEAFGFQERLVVPGDSPEAIAHAELRWPAVEESCSAPAPPATPRSRPR